MLVASKGIEGKYNKMVSIVVLEGIKGLSTFSSSYYEGLLREALKNI
jgi:hypothetical protein